MPSKSEGSRITLRRVWWGVSRVICILFGLWAMLLLAVDYIGDGSENEPGFYDTYASGHLWVLIVAALALLLGGYCLLDVLKDRGMPQ